MITIIIKEQLKQFKNNRKLGQNTQNFEVVNEDA